MRAIVFPGGRKLEVRQMRKPSPGPGELVVQVARAAICGTDVHRYRAAPAEQEILASGDPVIVGHEPVGWVSGHGTGISEPARGTRVMLAGVVGCDRCAACLAGENVACERGPTGLGWHRHGGNADFVVMPARNAFPLPEKLSFDCAAVLACAGGTAYTALREAGVRAGQRVVVVGLGPVGLCAVIFARALGCAVAGVEPKPERRKHAASAGAELLVAPGGHETMGEIRRWSNGRGGDVVVECVGSGAAQKLAIECAAMRGVIAFAGLGRDVVEVDLATTLIGRRGLRFHGVAATPIRYFPDLLAVAATCMASLERLVTHRFPLGQAQEAMALMESGRCGKVLLEVSDEFAG